jgi:hypothetical protein
MDAMCPIERRVAAMPCTTLEGLAVKARACKFTCSHFWREKDDDADWDDLIARKFIDAVLRFTSLGSSAS